MGEILLARDIELNREVALKRMLFVPDESEGPEAVRYFERFLEEAQITAQLDHPSIVPIHSIGFEEDGRAFYTMRLVRGRELGTIFRLVREGDGGWNQSRVIGILVKVCQAVAYAHAKGIAHRDLKPSNIMVGELGEVYVMDWGLAKAFECLRREALRAEIPGESSGVDTIAVVRSLDSEIHRGDTKTGNIVGTPAYLAPELAMGTSHAAAPQGDVYALGAVLYHLLSGHAPYMGNGQSTTAEEVIRSLQREAPVAIPRRTGVPAELIAICEQAMAREPNQRYATCAQMAEDLQAYLDGRVVRAYESGKIARFRKWVLRNRFLAVAATIALLALVAVAWISTWSSVRLTDALEETEQERERAVQVLAESFFLQGGQYYQQRDVRSGLAYWAQALEQDLEHHAAAARIAAICLQERIPLPASAPLRSKGRLNVLGVDPAGRYIALSEVDFGVRVWDSLESAWVGNWQFGSAPRRLTFLPRQRLVVVSVVHPNWQSGELHWLDLDTGGHRWPPYTFEGSVTGLSVTVSEDERLLAAGGVVWSLEDGRVVLAPNPEPVAAKRANFGPRTALSPDGRWLLLGAADGTVLVYDVAGRREVGRIRLRVDNGNLASVAWGPKAVEFLVSFDGGRGFVLRRETMETQGTFTAAGTAYESFALDATDRSVFLGSDGSIQFWDHAANRLDSLEMDHGSSIVTGALRADERHLLTVGADNLLRVWDTTSGRAVCEPIPFSVGGGFHRDRILSLNADGSLEQWRVPGRVAEPVVHRFDTSQWEYGHSAVTPDGQYLIGPGARAVELATEKLLYEETVPGAYGRVLVAVAPDSEQYAVTLDSQRLSLRVVSTGEIVWESGEGPASIVGLNFSPSGKYLAAVGAEGDLAVWRVEDAEAKPTRIRFQQPIGKPATIRFDASETRVCLSEWGGGHFAWNIESGELIGDYPQGDHAVYSFFAEGTSLQALVGRSQFGLWEERSRNSREGFGLFHASTIVGLDFSRDGRFVATASHDSTAQVWDLLSGQPVGGRLRHSGPCYSLHFDATGDRIATSSAGQTANLWDRQTGVRLMELPAGAEGDVIALAFTKRGDQLFGTGHQFFTLWDLPPGPREAIPAWWRLFAESLAGFRIRRVTASEGQEQIASEPVGYEEQQTLWREIAAADEGNRYVQIARWVLAAGAQRAASPFRKRSGAE